MMSKESRYKLQEYRRQLYLEQHGFGPAVMRSIRICSVCGLPSAADRPCCTCGGALSAETLFQQYKKRHKFCRHCDIVVSDDAKYCPACGLKI